MVPDINQTSPQSPPDDSHSRFKVRAILVLLVLTGIAGSLWWYWDDLWPGRRQVTAEEAVRSALRKKHGQPSPGSFSTGVSYSIEITVDRVEEDDKTGGYRFYVTVDGKKGGGYYFPGGISPTITIFTSKEVYSVHKGRGTWQVVELPKDPK
jgi:hypothetical protein